MDPDLDSEAKLAIDPWKEDLMSCKKNAHSATPPGDGPCLVCGRDRCVGEKDDGRCGNFPLKGAEVCRYHGASAPQVLTAATRTLHRREAEKVLKFWDPESAPTEDIGVALLRLAGRLENTVEFIGGIVNRKMEAFEPAHEAWLERVSSKMDECVCCGYDPTFDREPKSPTSSSDHSSLSSFSRQLGDLLTKIQALGLAERQIAFQEGQAAALATIISRALEAAKIDEGSAEIVRGEVLRGLAAIEAPTRGVTVGLAGD